MPRDPRRELEFRRARRHSALVRTLKVLLPFMALGVLSLYALPFLLKKSVDNGRGTASVRGIALEAGALKMIEMHVKGVSERGEPYDFTSATATQAAKDASVMYLDVVRGKMSSLDGKVTTLTAPDGIHNSKTDEMILNNGALVTRDDGFSATFQTATAFMKTQTVASKTPVVVRQNESTIHAEAMTLWWGENRVVFEGNVRTHIEQQQVTPPPGGAAAQGLETRPVDPARGQ
jgi:lipopolysaccharide export system protein LptC